MKTFYTNDKWTFYVFNLNWLFIFINKEHKRIIKRTLKRDFALIQWLSKKYNLALI